MINKTETRGRKPTPLTPEQESAIIIMTQHEAPAAAIARKLGISVQRVRRARQRLQTAAVSGK